MRAGLLEEHALEGWVAPTERLATKGAPSKDDPEGDGFLEEILDEPKLVPALMALLGAATKEEEVTEIRMTVPRDAGDPAVIEQLMHNEAVENLGLYARPDGNNAPHLKKMREK